MTAHNFPVGTRASIVEVPTDSLGTIAICNDLDRHDLHALLVPGCEQCDRRVEALLTPPPSSPRRSEGRAG